MSEILVLGTELINKIAAGEVVERPASVAKELVENALDAGATRIVVEIADGGLELIKVSDNGTGIPAAQAATAFLRHATSKLPDESALGRILTMGFRGEALSSIAAVSMAEMQTKFKDEETGTKIQIHGGILQNAAEIALTGGTAITVRNLFYNTPARRKFLKKPGTEGSYVAEAVERLSLGRPDVSFTFINNKVEVFHTSGASLRDAVLAVYGRDIAGKLLDVDLPRGRIRITGVAGKPECARGNRAMGNFFVNGRFIRHSTVRAAVEAAYKTKLTVGKFPVYVLNMDIPPDLVDVNVHPAKMEARFSRDVDVYPIMYGAVDAALKSGDLVPKISFNIPTPKPPPEPVFAEATAAYQPSAMPEIPDLQYIYIAPAPDKAPPPPEFNIVAQFFGVYWLVERVDGSACYIMDQHAVHERILYEEITQTLKSSGVISQRMISPVALKLSAAEARTVAEHRQLLINMGFEIEDMFDDNIAIRSVPYIFDQPADPSFFAEILDALAASLDQNVDMYDLRTEAISRLACRAAVKANDRLSPREARALIERALKLDNPFTCPHGRPVMVELGRKEIEKMFKRIQ